MSLTLRRHAAVIRHAFVTKLFIVYLFIRAPCFRPLERHNNLGWGKYRGTRNSPSPPRGWQASSLVSRASLTSFRVDLLLLLLLQPPLLLKPAFPITYPVASPSLPTVLDSCTLYFSQGYEWVSYFPRARRYCI